VTIYELFGFLFMNSKLLPRQLQNLGQNFSLSSPGNEAIPLESNISLYWLNYQDETF
jgi:hypothetical protein